jgi:ribosomal subunit interface protein
MTFPMIQFKATNVTLEDSWVALVEQKFQSLEKFIGDETDVKCDIEFEKETAGHHNGGRIHRVEVNLFFRGTLHRAVATEESFEQAIDEVREELDKKLRRSSSKKETLIKRGGRKIKEMLRFGKIV